MLIPLILILFRPGTTDAAWYSDTWRFRKLITINSSKVPSTQTNFPVLVSITDAGLKSHAQGTGNDILFTSSDGSTKLSHEIESFATGSGKLVAWVKIPSLSGTTDTQIYLYYGNPSSPSQQDATNVWDSNFQGVWHMKENPAGAAPQIKDSTANANNGTSNGSMTSSQQTAGQINGALDFDGVDDYVTLPADTRFAGESITISAWINTHALTDDHMDIVSKHRSSPTAKYFNTTVNTSGKATFQTYTACNSGSTILESNTTLPLNTWQHITWVLNHNTSHAIYINGLLDANGGAASIPSGCDATAMQIGWNQRQLYKSFNGLIDNVRVSSTARPADWIATEYNNQSDPASFLTVGQQAENKDAPVGWWKCAVKRSDGMSESSCGCTGTR